MGSPPPPWTASSLSRARGDADMAVIEAYVTNLGKYNEGELASSLLKFPTTREEVQEVLKQIGIDNIRYEEIFIADYGGDLPELNACLGNTKALTSSTIWPACSPSWTKAIWRSLRRLSPAASTPPARATLSTLRKTWIATISISACPMMKPWAVFTRRTWR
ncbi:antirestriction protein [Clostridioides difficile]|nr:antirestriction protein [Clostridioides difficile]